MSEAPYNLTWEQASALCVAGTAVRRYAWEFWIVHDEDLFWINIGKSGANARIVKAEDFTDMEFLAADWTTAEIEDQDVCVQAVPPRLPRAFEFKATATCAQGLIATAAIGDLSPGDSWRVDFYCGGELLGTGTLTTEKRRVDVALRWPLEDPDAGVYLIDAIFTNTGKYPGLYDRRSAQVAWPIGLFTYNTGAPTWGAGTSYPIKIPFRVARDWYAKKVLQISVRFIQDESYPGQTAFGNDAAAAVLRPWDACVWSNGDITISLPRNVVYTPGSPATTPEPVMVMLDLISGYRDGSDFYPKIEITHPVFTSLSTGGTGQGVPTATVLGYSIPMVSTWSPGWSGTPGYVNNSTFSVNVT